MIERVQEFLNGDHTYRILYLEQRVREHTDSKMRAYVGMCWSWIYKLNKESIDD